MYYTPLVEKPPGYFEVYFAKPIRSKYRNLHSYRSQSQQDILAYSWDDIDRMLEVRDIVETCPSPFHVFLENPLDNGYHLQSICSADKQFNFIDLVDMESGEVSYGLPAEGV